MKFLLRLSLLSFAALMLAAGCGKEAPEQKPETAQTETKAPGPATEKSNTPESNGLSKIYGFKSAILEYRVTSPAMEQAHRKTYIDDWGTYQTEETEGTLSNGTHKSTTMITRGNMVYNILPEQKIAEQAKGGNRSSAEIDFAAMAQMAGGAEAATKYLLQRGITLLDSAEVAGYPCQVYQQESAGAVVKLWNYKGLPLKMVVSRKAGGKTQVDREMEVTSAQFDVPVDSSNFAIPNGYKVMTVQEYQQMQDKKSQGQ